MGIDQPSTTKQHVAQPRCGRAVPTATRHAHVRSAKAMHTVGSTARHDGSDVGASEQGGNRVKAMSQGALKRASRAREPDQNEVGGMLEGALGGASRARVPGQKDVKCHCLPYMKWRSPGYLPAYKREDVVNRAIKIRFPPTPIGMRQKSKYGVKTRQYGVAVRTCGRNAKIKPKSRGPRSRP